MTAFPAILPMFAPDAYLVKYPYFNTLFTNRQHCRWRFVLYYCPSTSSHCWRRCAVDCLLNACRITGFFNCQLASLLSFRLSVCQLWQQWLLYRC